MSYRDWIVTLESGDTTVDVAQSRTIKVCSQVFFRAERYDVDPRFVVEEFYYLNEIQNKKRDMLSRFLAGERLLTTTPAEHIVAVVRNIGKTPIHYRLALYGKAKT